MRFEVSNNGPLIIAVSVAAGIVLVVLLFYIVRWTRRKPSTDLPPPRQSLLYTNRLYPTPDQRAHTVFIDDAGQAFYGPQVGYGSSPHSDSSKIALWKGDAEEGSSLDSASQMEMLKARDSLRSDASFGRLRHMPSVSSPLSGSPSIHRSTVLMFTASSPTPGVIFPAHGRDVSSQADTMDVREDFSGSASSTPTPGSAAINDNAAEPPHLSRMQSPSRPFSTISYSRHSIAQSSQHGHQYTSPPDQHHRRLSRHSMYSISTSRTNAYDDRRNSVRGAPHKTGIQIVLPEPLAPTAHAGSVSGHSAFSSYGDTPDSLGRGRRRSRADLWTEATAARSRTPTFLGTERELLQQPRRRRRSQGSETNSFDIPGHFVHMEPPPPLPTSSLASRSGTPVSTLITQTSFQASDEFSKSDVIAVSINQDDEVPERDEPETVSPEPPLFHTDQRAVTPSSTEH